MASLTSNSRMGSALSLLAARVLSAELRRLLRHTWRREASEGGREARGRGDHFVCDSDNGNVPKMLMSILMSSSLARAVRCWLRELYLWLPAGWAACPGHADSYHNAMLN